MSLPRRSLVAIGEEAAEVRLAMSLPVRLGAGIIMLLLTASGQGIWESKTERKRERKRERERW